MPTSRRFVAIAAAVASACAFALYARVAWPWLVLGWVGLVPWLAVLDRARSFRVALAQGLLMSETFVLAVFPWLPSAIQNYTGAPWALALLVVLVVAPLIQPQFIAFAAARYLAGQASVWRTILVGGCAYVGAEWASPKLFADTLGHGLYASALMRQAADIAGAHGLTFVLVVSNECVLAVLRATQVPSSLLSIFAGGHPSIRRQRTAVAQGERLVDRFQKTSTARPGEAPSSGAVSKGWLAPAACLVALVMVLLAYGAVRVRQLGGAGDSAERVTAGIVQADISQYGKLAADLGTFEAVRTILDTHFALSAEALERGTLDLLMWPETVYPTTFGSPKSADGAAFDREIGAFVAGHHVPLVFGAYDVDGGDEFNAAVLLEPAADGRVTFETYRKASLFPFTERVPGLFESTRVRQWLPWLGTWKPGTGGQVLPLALRDGRTLLIAPLICYDAVVPSQAIAAVRQGAELILTLSNDSWFTYADVPHLILVVSAFRSIETRRPQVRATNTGISAVITPTGEFLGMIGVHRRATLVATVTPERGAMTLMLAWGDWFGPAALASGVVLLAIPLVAHMSTKHPRA